MNKCLYDVRIVDIVNICYNLILNSWHDAKVVIFLK